VVQITALKIWSKPVGFYNIGPAHGDSKFQPIYTYIYFALWSVFNAYNNIVFEVYITQKIHTQVSTQINFLPLEIRVVPIVFTCNIIITCASLSACFPCRTLCRAWRTRLSNRSRCWPWLVDQPRCTVTRCTGWTRTRVCCRWTWAPGWPRR